MKLFKFLITLKIVGFIEIVVGLLLLYLGIRLVIRYYKKHKRKKQ